MSKKGQSLLSISKEVKCSRDAIQLRRDRWELEPPYEVEQFADEQPRWKLKPIDGRQADALSLEEARTATEIQREEKLRKENRQLDRELVPWEDSMELLNTWMENAAAIIKRSNMTDAEKEQIFDEIKDVFRSVGE